MEFRYVYGPLGRDDGFEFAVASTDRTHRRDVLFSSREDCQTFVDALRSGGEVVSIMPSAEQAGMK